MNQLSEETSPYLLQHKDNPVEWYAWGQEAFDRAGKEDKPILVSIGYSTCHWCHVMERESFEDEEVAELMNEHFINIKVDREEHPEVDQFYMEAVQIITRSGGWPLNCFLTPEGKPFYGGTYFPPESRYGRPSWKQLLQNVVEAFQNSREEIENQAEKITGIIEQGGEGEPVEVEFTGAPDNMEWVEKAVDELIEQWDREYGGFGGAPKFPSFPVLLFLFEYGCRHEREDCKELVLQTLGNMCLGGIYDQVGGGLSRYSTDEEWHVPHFEKMIYDNALLLRLLNRVYRETGERFWKRYLKKTVDFVLREWWDTDEGGFYSAFDADSEGEEGKYYVWTSDEWSEALPDEDVELLNAYYQITEEGNWEDGKNIPDAIERPEQFAEKRDLDPGTFYERLEEAEKRLLSVRKDRVQPGLDHKKILSWNTWMGTALVKSLELLERKEDFQSIRKEVADFPQLFSSEEDNGLVHHVTAGEKGHAAYLDDYAGLAETMIEAYRCQWHTDFLDRARSIMEQVIDKFGDEQVPLLFYSEQPVFSSGPRLPDFYDQTGPSGNALAALNLWNLGMMYDHEAWRERAWKMLLSVKERIEKFPRAFSTWLQLATRIRGDQYEIAVVGPDYEDKAAHLKRNYIPNTLIMASNTSGQEFPLLNRTRKKEETMLYLCSHYACEQPVASMESFMKMLKER